MDPKMDSGCLAPGESLDEDYDVTRPLLPSEVLGIIDQLLSLEVGLTDRGRCARLTQRNRWRGTSVIRSLRHYSQVFTLTEYWWRIQRRWRRLTLSGIAPQERKLYWAFLEPTA
jgi:hypothetical protein